MIDRLGNHVSIVGGGTPSRKVAEYWGGPIPWATVKDLNNGFELSSTQESITEEGVRSSATRILPQGTLVTATRMALGKAAIATRPLAINQDLKGLLCASSLDTRYLLYFLHSKAQFLEGLGKGATVKGILIGDLQDLEIPVPSLAEQKRIAAILDKADAIRRKRQQALALTDDLLRSTFLDMFGDKVSGQWTQRNIEWMAADHKGAIRTGPFGSQLLHSEFVDEGIAVLGIDNFVDNRFKWAKPRFISEKKYEQLSRYKVFPGDVVVTIMGTLGRCGVVPNDIPEAINTKHLCCVTLNKKKCLPEFLYAAFLFHPEIGRQLGGQAKGAIMLGLNMGIIKSLEIPLPPVSLQNEFVQATQRLESLRKREIQREKLENDLFSGCLQRAFRGEL